MSVSSRVQSWLLTGQHLYSLRTVLSSLLLVVALSVLGCQGSNGNDDDSSDIRDETITGSTLEVTLPPGFDPGDIARMELSVTGLGVPADLQNIPLDRREVTLGDRTILAFADTTLIPPGVDRVFTLQAFTAPDTRIPDFLGQETADLQDGVNTKVVMTLLPAIARLGVQPTFVDIEVGDAQQFRAIGHFGADCSTNDPATCTILLRPDLTSSANWGVTPPAGQPAIATISNAPENRGLAIGTIPGSGAVRATVEVLDGAATLNIRRATDIPSLFVTIAGLAVSEGNEGTHDVRLTVKLTMPPDDTSGVSVDFTTADIQARADDEDYLPTSGTLKFAQNETEKSITVSIKGDLKLEDDESFRVALSNPQPQEVQLLFSDITITILNDDTPPPPPQPPVANDDCVSTLETTGVLINVAANDTDPDDNLEPTSANTACVICSLPTAGTLFNNEDGTFTYTPNSNFNGTDTFVYQICDTDGLCDTATVTVTGGLTLRLESDGGTTKAIQDNGPGDNDPAVDSIVCQEEIDDFSVQVTSGLRLAGRTELTLGNVSVTSNTGGGLLILSLTDTCFRLSPSIGNASLRSAIGGVTDGTTTFQSYVDTSNTPCTSDLQGPFGPGAFDDTATTACPLNGDVFSITAEATITLGPNSVQSFGANTTVAPP